MAGERDPRPTDAAKCNWASDGVTYPPSDPGAPKRATGFKPIDIPVPGAGGVIPANDFNYTLKLLMEMVSWLRDRGPNEWSDIYEALANTSSASELFWVYAPSTGMRARGTQLWKITGTASGGGVIYQICTDGDQVYYISGASSERVVIAEPLDGSEIDGAAASDGAFSSICTDGAYIYASLTSATNTGLRRLLRGDGSEDSSAGSERACNLLRSNGEYCVGISPTSDAGGIVVWSGIHGTIAEDGVATTGSANIAALAVDHENAYVGGTRSTYDVWALDLSDVTTPTWAWRRTLPTTTAPTVASIACDGNAVYVATDRVALTAGGNANLFVLSRIHGNLLYTMDIPDGSETAADLTFVAVDDEYLYVTDDALDDLYVFRLRDCGKVGGGTYDSPVAYVANVNVQCADGVSIYGVDTADTTKLGRWWFAGTSKLFMRAASDDPTRRPFHTLAVPVSR